MGVAAELIAVNPWRFSVPDWEQRLRAGASLLPALPLDAAEAGRAAAIYDRLRLPDVPGQPTLGEAGGEWFRELVRAIFGSLDRATGRRMVPGAFVLVPKKNSKTTNAGALMLVALLMNRRPRAQFGLFGPTQEISDLAFQAVAGMIEADPDLRRLFHVQEHLKTIRMRAGPGAGSTLKVTTFDPAVATGGKYAGWLLDEAHLLGRMAKAVRVLGQMRGARTAIPEQFGVIITTQSDERPAGVFEQELAYARGVRDGRIPDGDVLPLLYEFPAAMQGDEEQPWRDPAVWPMVLPNLGRSVDIEVLKSDFAAAREKGAAEERRWASQHLNVEIGVALHAEGWAGAPLWAQAEAAGDLDTLIEASDVCVMGVDGGGLDDLLGVAVIGRDRESRIWRGWVHAWAHQEVFERRREIEPVLRGFERDGDLTVCRDATQDIREVAALAKRLLALGLLPAEHAIGLDPYGVAALVDALAVAGVAEGQMAAIGQGPRLSPAVWGMERKLKDGTFRPCAQPLLAWCVGNARAEQRGNAIYITKQTAGKAKIDPLVALFDAFMLMTRNPEAAGSRRPTLVLM